MYNDDKKSYNLFRIMMDSLMKECHVINEMAFSGNLGANHGFEMSVIHLKNHGKPLMLVLQSSCRTS